MPLHLYLIRHGETEWSLCPANTPGRTDIPLDRTSANRMPASWELARLCATKFNRVFTSPMQRARRTCALVWIGSGREIEPDLVRVGLWRLRRTVHRGHSGETTGLEYLSRRMPGGGNARTSFRPRRPAHRSSSNDGRKYRTLFARPIRVCFRRAMDWITGSRRASFRPRYRVA